LDGATPLAIATQNGRSDVVLALLSAGAVGNAKEADGYLLASLLAGSVDAVKALVGAGGDPEQLFRGTHRALQIAVEMSNTAMVAALLDLGVNIDSMTVGGYTALTLAAKAGAGEIARLLIAAHANLEARTPNGFTPLHIAVACGHEALVGILLEAGANVDAMSAGDRGVAPVWLAVQGKNEGVLLALLKAGPNLEVSGPDGCTPLLSACRAGWTKGVELLLARGANPRATSVEGDGAIALAGANERIVALLREAGA
jgi:ankyrin repeat protein